MRGIEGYSEDIQRQLEAKAKTRARGVDVAIYVDDTKSATDAINTMRPAKDDLATAARAEAEAQHERDRKQQKIDDQAGVKAEHDQIEIENAHLGNRNDLQSVREVRDIERGENTVTNAERAEVAAERLRKLQRLIRERLAEDEAHAFKTQANFERIVRDAEHQVGLDGYLKAGEIERLRSEIENRLRHDQTLADIDLRRVMRAHEADEAAHGARIDKARSDHDNTKRLDEAKTDIEIAGLHAGHQGRVDEERDRREIEKLRRLAEIDNQQQESATDRERRLASGKTEDQVKLIRALKDAGVMVTPEVSAMLLGQPAEVVIRVAAEFNAARDRAPAEKPQDSVAEREYLRGLVDKVVSELTSVAGKQADAARPVTQVVREPRATRRDA